MLTGSQGCTANLIWYTVTHSDTIFEERKYENPLSMGICSLVHKKVVWSGHWNVHQQSLSAIIFQCFTNDTTYHISVNESDCSEKHDPSWIWLANLTLFQCILWHNAPVITFDQLDISSVYEKWISTAALQANFGKCILHSHSAFSRPIIQFSLHLHIKPIL